MPCRVEGGPHWGSFLRTHQTALRACNAHGAQPSRTARRAERNLGAYPRRRAIRLLQRAPREPKASAERERAGEWGPARLCRVGREGGALSLYQLPRSRLCSRKQPCARPSRARVISKELNL